MADPLGVVCEGETARLRTPVKPFLLHLHRASVPPVAPVSGAAGKRRDITPANKAGRTK